MLHAYAIVTFLVQFDQQQSFVDRITQLSQADQTGSKCVAILFSKPQVRPLSAREKDVLRLVVEGYSNPEIAEALHLSRNTVKTHIRNLMNKFGVDRRVQLATVAITQGQEWKNTSNE